MSDYRIFVELADTWDVQAQDAEPAARRETLRECADGLRMLVDFKRKQRSTPCPHAPRPFMFCPECRVSPCPIGLGGQASG